jgi:hypothetical protein
MTVDDAAGDGPDERTAREQEQEEQGTHWVSQARRLREDAIKEHLQGLADALRRASRHADAVVRLIDEDAEGEGGRDE